MKKRLIKIAIIIVVCLIVFGTICFVEDRIKISKSKEKEVQEEALKNKDCKIKLITFNCPIDGGICKREYSKDTYKCTKKGKKTLKTFQILKYIVGIIGVILVGITIYKNDFIRMRH